MEHFRFHGLLQLIPVQSRQQRTSCNSSTGAVSVRPSAQGLPSTSPLPQKRVLEGTTGEDVGEVVGEDVGFFVGDEVAEVGAGLGGVDGCNSSK